MRNAAPGPSQVEPPRRIDNLSPAQRRETMRAVKSSGTGIELRVADELASSGVSVVAGDGLPGRPDFVLPELRATLFVHGCFWHSHGCRSRMPVSNREYWEAKLARNRLRDRRVRRELNRMGWTVLVLWGCRLSADSVAAEVAKAIRRAARSRSVGQRWLRDHSSSAQS